MPNTTARRERGIIRRLNRRISKLTARGKNPRRLVKSRARHRKTLRVLRPPLRVRAWNEMQRLLDKNVHEVGGNNRGPDVERVIRANQGIPGEAWCGDTVAVCYLWAGAKSVVRLWAAVRWLEKLLMRVRFPQLGHVVTYKWSHTGLFKRWLSATECYHFGVRRGSFWAGEGNTGKDGRVSDSTSGTDGVHLRIRHRDDVAGFWRVLR